MGFSFNSLSSGNEQSIRQRGIHQHGCELRVLTDVDYVPPSERSGGRFKPYQHASRERIWRAQFKVKHKAQLTHKYQKDYYGK